MSKDDPRYNEERYVNDRKYLGNLAISKNKAER
jgi:hypothetical protein